MKLRILSAALFWVALVAQTYAQCTSGCSFTYSLANGSSTPVNYTFPGSGNGTVLCIVVTGGGSATVSSGTINFNTHPNAVLCLGPGVTLSSSVNVQNLHNQTTVNNYGSFRASLTMNSAQNVLNNYGTFSGPLTMGHSQTTVNNMSGGTFSSSNFVFNSGAFNNNAGSTFNIPNNFTAGSGATFSGNGSFAVGGNFQTNNGSNVSIGGAASITGNVATNTSVNFGSSLSVGGNLQSNNSGPITVAGAATVGGGVASNAAINFNSSLTVTGNVQVNNGGPLSVSGAASIGGALTTNATTSFSSSLAVTGNLQVNNGGPIAVSGAATVGGSLTTNASSSFSSSLGVGGSLQVNNGGPLAVGSNLNVTGSVQANANINIGGATTITNSGNANPALQVNNGSTTTFTGGGNITGNFVNNGSTNFNGTLTVSGSITNNNGGTISSSSGSCKTLCGSTIANTGTISSTSGPNMNVCVAPTGGGTQTNVSVSITPTANVTGLSASVSGATVNGSFTPASPLPGGYIVLRKTSAFAPADLPVNNTTYSVGNTIGGATVVALLNNAATTFSYTSGCGSFYFAVVSASNNSGTCATYRTSSYTTTGPVAVSCNGPRYWVSNPASNWNNTANWSTSSGGTPGASVPAAANLAIFDNARNGNCTLDATVDVQGIQLNGYTGILTQNAYTMAIGSGGYSQNSGTFTGGSASVTINNQGLFALSGGIYTSTSATTTIAGTYNSAQTLFSQSAGTFNHNSGTWVFNSTLSACANPVLTLDVISSTQFYNLELNGVVSCGISPGFSTGTGDVVLAVNNLIHTDGIINGQFAVGGGLIVAAGADAGQGTITVNGTGAQTYTSTTGRTCQLVVSKASGTLTPAIGTTLLYCTSFSLTAGSFTAPSGTLNVGGQWGSNVTIFSHSAGTFTHNNGTVEWNPTLISCANPTLTFDIIPATQFYNFVVNGIAGCGVNPTLSTATGDVVACANNFTHTDGIINGDFSFYGNLSIGAVADGGTGTLTANGAGAQTHYQAAGTTRTCQIIVNKPTGAFTPAVGSTNLTMQGFSLLAGSFTAPTGTLNVGGPWGSNVTIFSHSAGTFTHNNGTVEWNPTLISCANPTLTFDIIPATQFYNFVVNGIAGCGVNPTLSTATGDVVACANNFTHTDGIINGDFSFYGNLSIGAVADGGTGTLTANGAGAQTHYQAAGTTRTCQIIVNKPTGAFTPAVGSTNLTTQGFSLLAGSFTAPTGTLNVGGPWGSNVTIFSHSAGTFTHNNGTVEWNPTLISCANPTLTFDIISATQFYNFVVNGIAGCGVNPTLSTATGDVVACANNFTHTDGIIAGAFSFQRNLSLGVGADGGTGTITANGTGAQTYYQAAGTPRTCQVHVNKSAGAFTPAIGTTDLRTQGFQLIAGSFTAPPGTLNVGGPWGSNVTIFGHSGGTFTHNSGTVEFNPNLIACANPTFTVDVIPATLLHHFVVNGIAGCGINATVSTATGDVVQGTGNFTHTDGIIAGNFAFYNNLVINSDADGGTGTITANGTGAQTYFQAAGTPRTCQVHVNKSAGAFTPAIGATDLRTQGFQLIAGSFTAPTGTLNVGGPWGTNVTIFGHSGGTFTHNSGTVEFNPNLIACANPTLTVDVIPATLLHHFVVNGIAGCGINATVSTATGDVVQGTGNFTHTDGIIAGNFAFYNNLVINSDADGGTGTITANGTGAQTYFQAAGTPRTCQLIVTKSAGALTPTGGTTDLLVQGFQLTAGSFTAPSGTLNVGGPWATSLTLFGHTGGTFLHNTGTVEFNATPISCANPTFTFNVIPSTELFNFRVNGQSGCGINATMTTAAEDTLDVTNTLTYNNGVCNAAIKVAGDVTVAATFDGGTGSLIFKGSSAQSFDLTGATNRFDGPVVMNKVSNSVTLLSACQLDAASQTITWLGGILNTTATNLLIIGNHVTSGSGSNSSFANGPVRKIGNQAFTFPTGKGTKFAQLYITAPAVNTDQFTAEYYPIDPNGTWSTSSKETTVNVVSTCEYWILDRTAGTSNVSVRLSWDNTRSCPVTNILEERVARWDGTQWINQGTNGSPTGNTAAGTVQSCGAISSFGASSPFTLATALITTTSYSGSPFCTSLTSPQAVTFSGLTGGSFSSTPAGLTLNSGSGAVTPSTSTAGTYTIRYSVATSVSCVNPLATASVTITALPVATISYATSPWCVTNGSSQSVTRTGTAGGTYSSTSGLTINPGTGAIVPNTSTAGTYTVTYTIAASGGCGAVTPTASVTVTALPTISYAGPYCTSETAPQAVVRTGVAGGTYSATPSGLSYNSGTGAITPSASAGNTYTVRYTYPASGGCVAGNTTTPVTITTLPAATISYAGNPFCSTVAGAQSVTRTGTSGGTYSSTAGLSLNVSSGAVTPSTSTAGTYTVTYTLAASGGCAAVNATAPATVTALPTASISYTGSPWCQSAGGTKTVSQTGNSGGTYSSTAGLSLNGSSGDINAAASTAGSYTVTYTISASGGCASVNATAPVTLNADVTLPATPSGTTVFCQGASPIAYTTSASHATGYTWSVDGAGNSVSGSSTTGTVTWDPAFSGPAVVSVSSLGCGGPRGPVSLPVTVNPTGMWLGGSNNWNSASNWCGGIPTASSNVLIPTGAVNMPQINANSFCNNLTLQNGTSLTINPSNNLTINGLVNNSGTFSPGSSTTVNYASASAQAVLPATYVNLTTSGAGDKSFTGTTSVSGVFTPGAAGHSVAGSTLVFNGTSAQNIPAFGFYNLTTSGNNTKTLTGDVAVDGDLNISNGSIALGANELTLNGTLSGAGNLRGNCTSEIRIGGTGNTGTLRFDAGQNTLGQLTMSKSAAGNVALGSDVNICNQLDLSQGTVALGSYNLTLLSGATSANQNTNSYVQTLDQMSPTGAGFFIREMTSGGGEFVAPVGTTTYTPAYIDNIGATRNFKVRAFNGVFEHGISGMPVTNIDASVNRTWEIEPLAGVGSANVSIRLQWNPADENASFPDVRMNNRAYIGKNEGGTADLWIPQNTNGSQLATAPYSIMTSGITVFSKFAIGNLEEPLPVVMGNLEMSQLPKINRLTWQSYSERGALRYEIHRSENGTDFERIGHLEAKGKASLYQFDDPASSSAVLYYKVKFVGEAAGDEQWSNPVLANRGPGTKLVIYPNPTGHLLKAKGDIMSDAPVQLVITDLQGRQIATLHTTGRGGEAHFSVSDVPSGVYMAEVIYQGEPTGKHRLVKL